MSLLELLHNQIDLTRVPFSDRGLRLLVFQDPGRSQLLVTLAQRLTGIEPGLDSYLHHRPFIQDLRLLDENRNALEFEITTSAEMIEFRTAEGTFRLVFQDASTLAFGIPPNRIAGLRFRVRNSFIRQTGTGEELKRVRNLAYATNGKITVNHVTPDREGYSAEILVHSHADCAVTLHVSDREDLSHPVLPFSESCKKAAARWQKWFERVPAVSESYRQKYAYAWWVMANNLVSPLGFITREAMMPAKAFYVGIWLWDSALHAIALRHRDPELARDQIRVMLEHQLPDGMLPDAIHDEGVVSEIDHPIPGRVTKPPILAWAALKLHAADPNMDFLEEIYPALERWNAWWFDQSGEGAGGLARYTHPYSSGLDDNPLWDYGMPVVSPNINTYLCIQMDSLAGIAALLGKTDEAAAWRRRAAALAQKMMDDLWDEASGLFKALHAEQPIPVTTPFNLYPLWTGRLPLPVTDRLIAHIQNTAEFWGDYPLPTVARNDPAYDPETMWRGPVWANVNYFFIEALRQAGRNDLARELCAKTLDLIMKQPGIHEYYNAETGKPPAKAAGMFG